MHYTGTIWRPPYEAESLLLEVTAGCTHHKCKFCTLYEDLPFKFRMSPLETIEADLAEAQMYLHDSMEKLSRRLFDCSPKTNCRVFLTGANPFVLQFDRLKKIGELIKKYFPKCESIGCFARITDITLKTDEELSQLAKMGYDGLTIGIETGDDEALDFMNKGYSSNDIITQCKRLDKAGIHYSFFYLVSISGAGRGEAGAKATANIINQLHPVIVGVNMLTIFQTSELYKEIQNGNWKEETELEKYTEIKTLIENIKIKTTVAGMGASNAFQFHGLLPDDKKKLIDWLDRLINSADEKELRKYRENLRHL